MAPAVEADRLDSAEELASELGHYSGWRLQDPERVTEALRLLIEEIRAIRKEVNRLQARTPAFDDGEEGTLADRLGLPT